MELLFVHQVSLDRMGLLLKKQSFDPAVLDLQVLLEEVEAVAMRFFASISWCAGGNLPRGEDSAYTGSSTHCLLLRLPQCAVYLDASEHHQNLQF